MSNEYTQADILTRLLNDLPESWDKSVGQFPHDIMTAVSYEFEKKYLNSKYEFERGLISKATGADLDILLNDFGFYRKGATRAAGKVTFTGKPGADINYGDLVASNSATYTVTESGIIGESGTAEFKIECTIAGNIGNSVIDTIHIIPIGLRDIYSVNNDELITGGSSVETDDEFRGRFTEYYSNPAASGNQAEYEKWAKEVDGVGYAKCIPIWNGGGTVKVVFSDKNNKPASDDLIQTVYNHIVELKPVCAQLTVATVNAVNVTLKITDLEVDASFSRDKVKQDIAEYADEYFSTLSLEGDTIAYFKVVRYVMQTSGLMSCGDISFIIDNEEYKSNYELSAYSVATLAELEA